ncbi:LysR family transcriptional regulator [Rhodococcus sp. PAMC28707]|uniref:LysR family transcriptional regulator n=1 Tax=unclassified Rhodococcus (in: high G+C Gram-positive bacteria) TaxID=192944 RepID=UPI00109DB0C5|nr:MULTISPECIES: LysR family transcriptional regulator [unclassified Rhodococcus (in: high G+C Gram-positive bacteria)]QCB49658.1 LysR family transcriptional regulator [Rhodococcus sp. PAMC28705]QCB58651.1 LysR family transcriptional regulator [Rhodococcus sp. PAMC28707]
MIDVGALRALHVVALVGTIAKAAEELGYTASAVSQQIKRLERQLGVAVMVPAGRTLTLTPAGRMLVATAPDVFQALERCTEAALSVSVGLPHGRLRVVAFSTAVRGLLAPILPALGSRYPDVRINIEEQDPGKALSSVEAGTADLALVHNTDGMPRPLPASMTKQLVHTDVGDVVMRRTHPLAVAAEPLTSADLIDYAWVTSPRGTLCHEWFRRLFADLPHEPDVRHLIDDFSTQLALVSTHDVLALIPRLARPPLGEDLIFRELHREPKRDVYAVWRISADNSPTIRALMAELAS